MWRLTKRKFDETLSAITKTSKAVLSGVTINGQEVSILIETPESVELQLESSGVQFSPNAVPVKSLTAKIVFACCTVKITDASMSKSKVRRHVK